MTQARDKTTPSDGHPLDSIHYREYKILLKPERFFRPEGFEQYWKIIHHIGKKHDVGVKTHHDGFNHKIREVLFYDTENYDLYNNAFILRKRTFYKDGWPEIDHELTVKFRHSSQQIAAATDIHPNIQGGHKIKFKEELLPVNTGLGNMRSLFSHNCQLVSPNIVLDQGLEDITQVFPVMKMLDILPKTRIELVNRLALEEVQVNVGEFHFGHGLAAKASISIWRNRATETSLVGEFTFQVKFHRIEELHHKAKKLSEKFYCAVQAEAPEWVHLGTTKTAMVYGLGGKPGNAHE